MSAPKRRNWIGRQFAARPVEMLESPAMRVLTLAERRALDRIEIEYAHHGGADNGKLPITYADFERFGLHPNVIAPSLRTLAALGFIEVTRKGYGGAAGVRAPSWYRLTYRSAWNATHRDGDGTHEYLAIKTVEEAEAITKAARRRADHRNVERAKARQKNQNATLTFRGIPPSEKEGETENSRPHISRVQAHPRKTRVLSKVSGRDRPSLKEMG
jgi:hypothetical protein